MNKTIIFIIGLLNFIWCNISIASSPNFIVHPKDTSNGNWIVKSVNPSKDYNQTLIVKNLENKATKLNLEFLEFTEDNGHIQLLENQKYKNIGNWITPTNAVIQLSPNEQKQINFKIKIPNNVSRQQYQGAFLVSKNTEDVSTLNIKTRIGNRIYLNVTDNIILENNVLNIPISETNLAFILIGFILIGYPLFYSKRLIKN